VQTQNTNNVVASYYMTLLCNKQQHYKPVVKASATGSGVYTRGLEEQDNACCHTRVAGRCQFRK